jgi:hypothetical protein
MTRLHTSTHGKFYRSGQVRRQGSSLAFDEGRPEEVDPVQEICKWALANLTSEQLQQLCSGLQPTGMPEAPPPANGGMDDEEFASGYPGGRRDGPQPANAGPWQSKLGALKKNGAMDSGLHQLAASVRRDAAVREEFSFDRLFNPHASDVDSKSSDVSLDSIFGFGGGDAGERSPSVDHLSRAPLWTTLR